MKTLMKLRRSLSILIVPAMVLFAACSDPAEDIEDDGNSNGGELTEEEADKISDSFAFTNSVRVTGIVPTVVNTSLLKTNSKDTIYTMPGLKIPLRISHPAAVAINGWFIAVKNSTYYYDVPILEEEDSDTVSVVILEIDPERVELPYDIPVEITPYDQNKVPVDVIERIVTVEDPVSGGCDILIDGDTTNIGILEWRWHATVVFDSNDEPRFVNAPARVFGASQKIGGCCNEDPLVCPQAVYNPITKATDLIYDSEVTAGTMYSIAHELFSFYKDGTFFRFTLERIKNFSYDATDWCNGVPGFNERESVVHYYGTHDYAPGNTSISYANTHSYCDDPNGICGYGSRDGAVMVTCHMMVITAGVEGSKEVRMYVRHTYSDVWDD